MTKKTCSFSGCGRPHAAKGFCKSHYNQFLKTGVVKDLSPAPRTAATRDQAFWSRVSVGAECWEWTGGKAVSGHAVFSYNGVRVMAYRYSYEQATGEDITGKVIDHLCHNPACVNPSHLRATDHTHNMQNRKGAHVNSRTGVRGVWFDRHANRWRAVVMAGGRRTAKMFTSVDDANDWVAEARLRLHE